jgi:6-phosphogluconolactonase
MNLSRIGFGLVLSPALAVAGAAFAFPAHDHGVFVMTNDAERNEIIAYSRGSEGRLDDAHIYRTEGRGSGGTTDPLASQGSLVLSQDGNWLLAANAASGTITSFAVSGSRLFFSDKVPTGGAEPNSIAQHGNLVYVLNAAGASSVVGFRFDWGRLTKISGSIRYLSGTAVGPGSVAFSPDGRWLAVTEKATPSIDIFKVQPDGTLSNAVINKQVGAGTFSALFAPNGTLVVTETGPAGATNASAISSYAIQADGTLKAVSSSVPTLGAATCWEVVVDNGKYVFTSNAGTANISGFALGSAGQLSPLGSTIVAANPSGSTNLDAAASADGKFLYTLNSGTGTVGIFAINPANGSLKALAEQGNLPAGAGINGIAAN